MSYGATDDLGQGRHHAREAERSDVPRRRTRRETRESRESWDAEPPAAGSAAAGSAAAGSFPIPRQRRSTAYDSPDQDDRPRGVADTGDRPRGIRDTSERARGAVSVAGRAVVAAADTKPAVELPDPRGYAHVAIATGKIVFLAGQSGIDRDGRIVDGGLVAQFERAIKNLLTALNAVGGSPEHLSSVEIQVTSIDDYKANAGAIASVWRTRLGTVVPALSLNEVRRFLDADALVQLTAQAVIP